MRITITGASGQLGAALAQAASSHDLSLFKHSQLDVADADAVMSALEDARPDVVIHAAAMTDVDACEQDPEAAHIVNVEGTANVVVAAGSAFVIVISTDYVFDGMEGRTYIETDEPRPLQVYGRTKLAGEEAATTIWGDVAVVRSACLYGARRADGSPARNFVSAIRAVAREGNAFDVVEDQVGSPTSVEDLAPALVLLAENPIAATFHVVNEGAVSRADFARAICEESGIDASLVRSVAMAETPRGPAARPPFAPLGTVNWPKGGFDPLPDWRDALARAVGSFA